MADLLFTEHAVKHVRKTFTIEEIRGLETFFELIPAPGEGKFNQMVMCTTMSKHGTHNYSAHPIKFYYGSESGQSAYEDLHYGVLNCSHDKITLGQEEPELEIDNGFDTVVNQPIGCIVEDTIDTAGDGQITLDITYVEYVMQFDETVPVEV